jgi:multimeric flavodoxin WrbA
MKVLMINGSPHENGCTYTALYEVAKPLQNLGILVEFFHIGQTPVWGCQACGVCHTHRGACVQDSDVCNQLIKKAETADGFIFGSPVYYSGPNGAFCAILDRAFYAGRESFFQKPAAVVLSCRRGGGTAAFDRLNKYLTINQMPVVSSQYWNVVHGMAPAEVKRDVEGLQIMRTLGKNMAWMLQALATVNKPASEARVGTNFIR